MRLLRSALILALIGLAGCAAQIDEPPQIRLDQAATGLAAPVYLTAPDGDERLFVVDQVGMIWVIVPGTDQPQPFLDIRDKLVDLYPTYDERGLLGLAFSPPYAEDGTFYVYYSAPPSSAEWDHTSIIAEYHVSPDDPNRADPNSERVVLAVDKPGYNYEGGHIAFGPDGFLYVAMGDNTANPDTEIGGHAEDPSSPLGKILRVDIHSGKWSVYASGFRNPYRFSFDPEIGMIAGDVGHALVEEIDVVQAGGDYGWPIREGNLCFNEEDWVHPLETCAAANPEGASLIDPVIALSHADGYSAVIGGYVYRGAAIRELQGWYVFGDWGRGEGKLLAAMPGEWSVHQMSVTLPNGSILGQVLGIGRDASGELYVLTNDPRGGPHGQGGAVYRITAP